MSLTSSSSPGTTHGWRLRARLPLLWIRLLLDPHFQTPYAVYARVSHVGKRSIKYPVMITIITVKFCLQLLYAACSNVCASCSHELRIV